MIANKRSGRVTVGMFGWMHAGGVGQLADVGPGRLTGQKYIEMLQDVLLPSVEILLFPQEQPFYLVQDNSPIHTCHAVQEWFEQHPYITLLPHPPRSPDLNPIEHVWSAMNKYNTRTTRGRHMTRNCVLTRAFDSWEHLRGPEGCELTSALVASMPRRLNAVIEAGGGYTCY